MVLVAFGVGAAVEARLGTTGVAAFTPDAFNEESEEGPICGALNCGTAGLCGESDWYAEAVPAGVAGTDFVRDEKMLESEGMVRVMVNKL